MSQYVGAIDQGTTSSRFMVFDQQGTVVAVAQREHEQIYPKPGWVEHDAAAIWRNTEALPEGWSPIVDAANPPVKAAFSGCGQAHHPAFASLLRGVPSCAASCDPTPPCHSFAFAPSLRNRMPARAP